MPEESGSLDSPKDLLAALRWMRERGATVALIPMNAVHVFATPDGGLLIITDADSHEAPILFKPARWTL